VARRCRRSYQRRCSVNARSIRVCAPAHKFLKDVLGGLAPRFVVNERRRRYECSDTSFVTSLEIGTMRNQQPGQRQSLWVPFRTALSSGVFPSPSVPSAFAPNLSSVSADAIASSLTAATREFSLTATGCDAVGDSSRCKLLFQSGRAGPVLIDRGFTGWVYVTPDARYVFTEPLYVLDVRAWTQYALFDALDIQNYVSIGAISRDGRRLVISRTDCPFDCKGEQRRQYYELTLPK